MKKYIILLVLVFAASTSFAGTEVSSGATGAMSLSASTGMELHAGETTTAGVTAASATSPLIGKTSTGVGIAWATNVNGYAVVTQHKSGTRGYASAYDSTSIFASTDQTPGTAALTSFTATDTTAFSSWREL